MSASSGSPTADFAWKDGQTNNAAHESFASLFEKNTALYDEFRFGRPDFESKERKSEKLR